MNLEKNLGLRYHLWKNHGKSLMNRFEPEVREKYAYIFVLGDFESLLKAKDPILVERVELYQACLIEGMIKMALDEIMEPFVYETRLPSRDHIEIVSHGQLGIIHSIRENSNGYGFELSRYYGSKPEEILDMKICHELDDLINSIAGLEKVWREKKGSAYKKP
ncbi:hypothetical protein HOF92_12805 [bacterium]|jgi:hypothetical protein|nr:hypothetical protein [bacterium]